MRPLERGQFGNIYCLRHVQSPRLGRQNAILHRLAAHLFAGPMSNCPKNYR
jgi:hypothetical protein